MPSLFSAHIVRRTLGQTSWIAASLTALALTGCGLGSPAVLTDPIIAPPIAGTAFGGPIPIAGATVKIYATGASSGFSTGYGVGTLMQEANTQGTSGQDTTGQGAFQFAGGYTCPAGQFVYIVVSGGNTGSGVNPNSVLVAALGRCEDLYSLSSSTNMYTGYSGSGINVNELTTIAAAYALGRFSTTGGSGASTVVSIGATAVNNAPQVSSVSKGTICAGGTAATATATLGTGTNAGTVASVTIAAQASCGYTATPGVTITPASGDPGSGAAATANISAAGNIIGFTITTPGAGYATKPTVTITPPAAYVATAGLAHAFLNAANLVNAFPGTGLSSAYANVPGNSTAVVPQQLINTLGNILLTCVNTMGGSAGDSGTPCGLLFTATTIGSNVPTNTFSAMVNLAANPTLGGSGTAVTNFYNLDSAFTMNVYSPALTTSTGLNDYSIAINYPAALGLKYPLSGAVDLNDVYYVGNSQGSSTGPVNVLAFSSNGTALGTSGNTSSSFTTGGGMSLDALGNGYFGNGNKSGTYALAYFTTGGGTSLSTPGYCFISTSGANYELLKVYATAVDANNTLWVGGATNSGSITTTLYNIANPSAYEASTNCNQTGTPVAPTGTVFATAPESINTGTPPSNGIGLAIDPDQNVWITATTNLAIASNTGSIASPTYTANAGVTSQTTGSPALGVTFAGSPYVAYVSSYNGVAGVQSFTPGYSTAPTITRVTAGSLNSPKDGGTTGEIAGSYNDEADGSGIIWTADYNSKSVIAYNPTGTPVAYRVIPTLGGSTTPSSIFGGNKPINISIDSAGSVWVVVPASASIAEIIGSAAPTWPLLSLGRTGQP